MKKQRSKKEKLLVSVFFFFFLFSFSEKVSANVYQSACGDIVIASPTSSLCYYDSGHGNFPATIDEYWIYRGYYPDVSSTTSHQIGSFSWTNMEMKTYEYSVWWSVHLTNGDSYIFSFVYSNGSWYNAVNSNLNIPDIALNVSTTSSGFLSFLNVPELLKTRAPFAYLPLMWGILSDTSGIATSTIASSTLSFVMASGTASQRTISVDFFSETVFRKFLDQNTIDLLRNLMLYILYASTGWFIYHDLKNRKIF